MSSLGRACPVRSVDDHRALIPMAKSFGAFVNAVQRSGRLVVQPRMGMSAPQLMRSGLLATRQAEATTVGTITLDSYTRLGSHDLARRAIAEGAALNGYPIVAHNTATTLEVIEGIAGPDFPIQVRHGSPSPYDTFEALVSAGLAATEGGPVSYCLPYSRNPLKDSVADWARCCEMFVSLRKTGVEPHMETFGGCMIGQLCPPSLLIALAVLEALFFRQHGLRSVSLSYAQQTSAVQDEEAITALDRIAGEMLGSIDWHIVIYAYMGLYPRTPAGSKLLLEDAARLSVRTGAARLIVKTAAEAHRIPTISENVAALETAARAASSEPHALREMSDTNRDAGIYDEARGIIDAVLALDPYIGQALVRAFATGLLDVPYCLHPDNAGASRSFLDSAGRLHWSDAGSMPVRPTVCGGSRITSAKLLASLSYAARKFDQLAATDSATAKPAKTPLGTSYQADGRPHRSIRHE